MREPDKNQQSEIEPLERWLAGFDTPPPSAELIERTCVAARHAFQRGRAEAATSARGQKAWYGAVAAAALILLSVAVAWQAVRSSGGDGVNSFARNWPPIELTVSEDDEWVGFDSDLRTLESWEAQADWELGGADLYEAFESLDRNESPADSG